MTILPKKAFVHSQTPIKWICTLSIYLFSTVIKHPFSHIIWCRQRGHNHVRHGAQQFAQRQQQHHGRPGREYKSSKINVDEICDYWRPIGDVLNFIFLELAPDYTKDV